jgi:hypothetical protein
VTAQFLNRLSLKRIMLTKSRIDPDSGKGGAIYENYGQER